MIELSIWFYGLTLMALTAYKVACLKYREPAVQSINRRLDALEARTVHVKKEDWDAIRQEVAGLRVANGLRTRK